MRHQRVLLMAALLLVAGCDSGVTATETSMMRGPTPSSGMTVPRLLTASAPPNFSGSAGPGSGSAADLSDAVDPSGAVSTDDVAPPEASDTEILPPDDVLVPTESLSDDGLTPGGTVPLLDPGTAVDLESLAAAFGCTDYLEQPALPESASYGECLLGEEPVQLYGFSTNEQQGAFIEQVVGEGLTVDQLVQGQLYIVIPGPAQLETVRAALTAG
jgi:hypothetical protein